MSICASGDDRRRGLVLGLTMAEALLLLIFLILLAFAAATGEMEEKIAAAEKRIASLSNELIAWRQAEDAARAALGEAGADKERGALVRERLALAEREREALIEARERVGTLRAQLAEVEKRVAAHGDPAPVLESATSTDVQVSQGTVLERVESAFRGPGSYESVLFAVEGLETARDLRAELLRLAQENRRLIDKNRLLALENESMRQSGAAFPSCWSSDDGDADYLFDISARDGGLVVRDAAPKRRKDDPAHRLLGPIERGVRISPERFQAATARLFQWSKEHRCRFFVILHDDTGPMGKLRFRRIHRAVEAHFHVGHGL